MKTMAAASRSVVSGQRTPSFNIARVRGQFPTLQQQVHGYPLVYLDNAATTQKPQAVLDALRNFYERDNSNIHRGVHTLSVRATEAYEQARRKVQDFIRAARAEEIVFVRGTTEAINLVAQTFGRTHVAPGDKIVISGMEHHSNIVPWQMLCEQTGARLEVIPISDDGEMLLEEYERLLGPRTKLVALVHISNVLGTINPIEQMIGLAHQHGIPVLIDGAQAVPHLPIDVQALNCDFYAFSGHKLFGPTGIGVLYGKANRLEAMPPYQGGGDMIAAVTFEKTTYNRLPYKFEAGTPHVAGGIGLGAAIDYLHQVGLEAIAAYEAELLRDATEALATIPQVRLIGTAPHKAAVLSFVIAGIHPHDAGTILDELGIAIRTGHHCAQPVMERYRVPATCRASLAFYNTEADIDALVAGIRRVLEVFG